MSKSASGFGKPLKGLSTAGGATSKQLEDSIINQISNGSIALTNINITGGTMDGVVVGTDTPGPGFFTTLQTGTIDNGYNVIFYGDTSGEYAQWDATLGIWNVSGDLDISGTSNLGNITISGNTIGTVSGGIIIDPIGTNGVTLNGSLTQTTTSGNVSFQTTSPTGTFSASSTQDVSLTSTAGNVNITSNQEQNITSNNGDIIIESGASKTTYSITNITTGSSPTITTSVAHNLQVGDSIAIVLTNSTPVVNGTHTVNTIVDSTKFTITPPSAVTVAGNTGTFTKNLDIYLTADANINIPYDVRLTFGQDDNYLMASSSPLDELTLASDADINISATGNVNIPNNVGITFGSDLRRISSDGTNVLMTSNGILDITATTTVLNSNLQVNGTSVTFDDTILTIGGDTAPISNNLQDRGIEFKYFSGTSKLGFFGFDNTDNKFTYFLNATNTGEVISGTLGDAKFANGSFTSITLNGGSISAGQIDVCNLYCAGTMNITGVNGINLNTNVGNNITIPQGALLRFGNTGTPSTVIYKEASGIDLVVQSQGHVFLTPGSTAYDVIIPQQSAIVLNGEGGSQKIKSNTATELTIQSSSFLNLTQASGGVRLTEGLPLIFNQDETTKITGDNAGNMIVNAAGAIELTPVSGHVRIPNSKNIQFGSSPVNIGAVGTALAINSNGSITTTSATNNSIISTSGDVYLTPSNSTKNVIVPANRGIILGTGGEYIRTDSSNNLTIASTGQITTTAAQNLNLTSTASNILLSPNGYVNIPYTKPLRFGSANENITGTAGNLTFNGATSNISGNLIVNGTNTTINSINVLIDDPIITLGETIDDNKDRGVEFNYYDTTAKLGYFGYDDTDGYFMYILNATNNSEVISGALGNAKFATGSFTAVNLNGGNVTNVNTLSGQAGVNLTITPASGRDLVFNVDSGRNISIPPNVDLLFDGEDAKFYSDGIDLHVDVETPGRFLIDTNTVINGDLSITGNVNISGGSTTNLTTQRFSVLGGGTASPNGSSNVTFVSVTSSGIATGTQIAAAFDGFIKNVCISFLASGATYQLSFPTGMLLNPGSGTTVATKMKFEKAGQSVQMVWDIALGAYIITQGGGELVLL